MWIPNVYQFAMILLILWGGLVTFRISKSVLDFTLLFAIFVFGFLILLSGTR